MSAITLQEAQARLSELIAQLEPGTELLITDKHRPVARLVAMAVEGPSLRPRPPITGVPRAGQYEGRLVVPADFDEPLDELREYWE